MIEINNIRVQSLAFLGDAVFDLMVREKLIKTHNLPLSQLDKMKKEIVCCEAQAKLAEKILPNLRDDELAIFRRGKNTKFGKTPVRCDDKIYRKASGLEALYGYLFLKGEITRLAKFLEVQFD